MLDWPIDTILLMLAAGFWVLLAAFPQPLLFLWQSMKGEEIELNADSRTLRRVRTLALVVAAVLTSGAVFSLA